MKKQKRTLVFEESKLPANPKDVAESFKGKPYSEITDYLYESFISTSKKEKEKEKSAPRCTSISAHFYGPHGIIRGIFHQGDHNNNNNEEQNDNNNNNNNNENNNGNDDVNFVNEGDIEYFGNEAFIPGFTFDGVEPDDFIQGNNDDDDDDVSREYLNTAMEFRQLLGPRNDIEEEDEDEIDDEDDDEEMAGEEEEEEEGEGDDLEFIDDDDDDDIFSSDDDSDNEGNGNRQMRFREPDFDTLSGDEENINLTDTTTDEDKVNLLNNSKYSTIRECMWLLGLCDPSQYITQVKSIKSPSKVCGKILAPGEHGYKCSTCENDSSCVLCVDCFDPSKHVGHSYRLIQVVGGCCDCGDPCAWNPAGFCSRHNGIDPCEDMLKYFPAEFVETSRAVVRAMVWATGNNVMEDRKDTDMNNEIIRALNKLTKLLGYGFGRIVIQELTRKMPGEDSQSTDADGKPRHELYGSSLWRLIEHDAVYRTDLRKELYSMYITLLADPLFKMSIGRVIASLYRTVNHNITASNSNIDNSVMSLNVQVFTVPAYSTPIIRETNLIENLLEEAYDQFKPFVDTSGYYSTTAMGRCRGSQANMLYDLVLILDQAQNARLFFRSPNLLEKYIRLVEPLQGAFSYKHKKGEHVLVEKTGFEILAYIDHIFTLTIKSLSEVSHSTTVEDKSTTKEIPISMDPSKASSSSSACSNDGPLTESERLEALRIFCKTLSESAQKNLKRSPRKLIEYDSEHSVHIVLYDITSKPVSQFNPVSRLVSRLIHGYLETGQNPEPLTKIVSPLELLEAPLEIFALMAQTEAGIWVRNGMQMNFSVNTIRGNTNINNDVQDNMFLMQYCAAVAPHDSFILTFLNRYGLADQCSAFTKEGQGIEYRPLVLSRALRDLVEIALSVNGLPNADPRAVARDELIQALGSKKSQPYGVLSRAVSKSTRTYMGELLPLIAKKTPQTVTTPAKYSLKTECYTEVDPYDATLTKQRIGVFEELWTDYVAALNKKKRKKTPKPVYPCPRVRSAPHPLFEKLPSLLSERPVASLVARAICGEFTEGDGHIESRLLTVCLHILMLCAEERAVCSLDNLESVVLDELMIVREVCKEGSEEGKEGEESKENTKKVSALDTLCELYAKDRTFWLLERVLNSLKSSISKNAGAAEKIAQALRDEGSESKGDEDSKESKKAALKRKSKQESIFSKLRTRYGNKIEELERSLDSSSELGVPPSKSPHLEEDDDSCCSLSPTASSLGASVSGSTMACEDDSENVCVLCHEGGGNLSWIGYCQQSDLLNAAMRNGKDAVFWKGNCKEEAELFDEDADKSEESSLEAVYETPLMHYLKRGLSEGVYIQRCNHTIHESCLAKYIETTSRQADEDDMYHETNPIDARKGLFSCPACKRLSNMTIPVTGIIENVTFPLTVNFKENGVSDVFDYQDTYLVLTRSLAYTLASHELAARPSEKNSIPDIPPQKVSLQKILFSNIITLFSVRDEDDKLSFSEVLDSLVLKHGTYNKCVLPSFESLNVFILRAILYKASGINNADNTNDNGSFMKALCGTFLSKIALSELVRIAAALDKSEPSPDLAPYLEPFLRRAVIAVSAITDVPMEQLCTEIPLFTSLSDKQHQNYNAVEFVLKMEGAKEEFSLWLEALAGTSKKRDRGFSPIAAAPASPFHIIQLPQSFMECVKADIKSICPNCKKHPKTSAVCLACGRVVCVRSRCCSDGSVGECNIHAQYCLHGPGMYFNAMLGKVILLRSDGSWGVFWHSPYIDEHGEECIDHIHDTPMFLSEDRVKQLERFILDYEIDNLCTTEEGYQGFFNWRYV